MIDETLRERQLKHKFGIDLEQYMNLLKGQKGVCAICHNGETSTNKWGEVKNLAVDHDHETGIIRGLLCQGCNAGLGHFRDDKETLTEAIRYLGEKS